MGTTTNKNTIQNYWRRSEDYARGWVVVRKSTVSIYSRTKCFCSEVEGGETHQKPRSLRSLWQNVSTVCGWLAGLFKVLSSKRTLEFAGMLWHARATIAKHKWSDQRGKRRLFWLEYIRAGQEFSGLASRIWRFRQNCHGIIFTFGQSIFSLNVFSSRSGGFVLRLVVISSAYSYQLYSSLFVGLSMFDRSFEKEHTRDYKETSAKFWNVNFTDIISIKF